MKLVETKTITVEETYAADFDEHDWESVCGRIMSDDEISAYMKNKLTNLSFATICDIMTDKVDDIEWDDKVGTETYHRFFKNIVYDYMEDYIYDNVEYRDCADVADRIEFSVEGE